MEGVSIVVCCYNAATRIGETVKQLSVLRHPGIAVEIILVNNASADDTEGVAEQAWEENYREVHGIKQFRIVRESTPGLSAARKKGLSEAAHDFLIFVDDDNWLHTEFIVEAEKAMQAYPTAAVAGGKGIPFFEGGNKPEWFDGNESWYAVGAQGTHDGIITKEKGYVYGAATCWKTDVLNKIYRQPVFLTGRSGTKLTSGEDCELCYKAVLMGYDIVYTSTLTFVHFIPEGRQSLAYIEKMKADSVRGEFLLHGYLYKLGTHEKAFDSYVKRTWWGQIVYRVFFALSGKGAPMLGRELKALLSLNVTYNRLFK